MAVDVLSKLANKTTLSILGKVEKKICGKGFLRARKGFTLFTSNEGLNDIVKIVNSLEKSGLLINGATETVKHEIKNHKGGFFGAMMVPMATSLIAPKAFSFIQPLNKPAPSLIDLNSVGLNYYSFMISLDKCNGSCNSVDDLSAKICVPNKAKSVNVKVFNMATKINETKILTKHISCDCKRKFDSATCNSNQKWNNETCRCKCKDYHKCKKDYSCIYL